MLSTTLQLLLPNHGEISCLYAVAQVEQNQYIYNGGALPSARRDENGLSLGYLIAKVFRSLNFMIEIGHNDRNYP